MIKISALHSNITRQLNRVNSSYNKNITVVAIDGYINQAKEIILENINSIYEYNKTLGNQLKSLEIRSKELTNSSKENYYTNFKLPDDHYSTLSVKAIASKDNCESEIFMHHVPSHKIEESLRDPKWKPSYEWRESFYNEHSNYIAAYHNNEFDIKSLIISYIKYVPDVAFVTGVKGAYIKEDGSTPTEDKHLFIDSPIVHRKIEDIAIALIRRDMDENYKFNLETILFNQRAYT